MTTLTAQLVDALGYLRAAKLVRSEERDRMVQTAATPTPQVAEMIKLIRFPEAATEPGRGDHD